MAEMGRREACGQRAGVFVGEDGAKDHIGGSEVGGVDAARQFQLSRSIRTCTASA